MTPRPFHRSIVFWAGIVVMGFLAWAWWISYRNLSIAAFWRVEATHSAGGLALMVQPMSTRLHMFNTEGPMKMSYGKHGEWIYDLVTPGGSADLFPPLLTYSEPYDHSWSILLPHWLIMLVVGIGWLLALGLWQRRKSRLLKLHALQ